MPRQPRPLADGKTPCFRREGVVGYTLVALAQPSRISRASSARPVRRYHVSHLRREPMNRPPWHWRWLVGGALFLSGCAIATPHLNISQWPVSKRAMYYRDPAPYRLAVLPLVDERPLEERQGKRPAGFFLLVWNRRVGDYVTGDYIYGGSISQQLTDQLSTYLQSAHVFAEVIQAALPSPQPSSQADADNVQRVAREQVVDYVLGVAVEHFYGSQHQHTS